MEMYLRIRINDDMEGDELKDIKESLREDALNHDWSISEADWVTLSELQESVMVLRASQELNGEQGVGGT